MEEDPKPVKPSELRQLEINTDALARMEEDLTQDFDYFKRQAYNKLYVTELMNCIFSVNHQTFNILLTDYFDKKFSQALADIVKIDKLALFKLRPESLVVDYVNNEFELCDELEKEIALLQQQLKEVLAYVDEAKKEHLLTPEMIGGPDGKIVDPVAMAYIHEQELKQGYRLPTKYEAKTEELRLFCQKLVQHGIQSANWQQLAREKFEKITEELKDIEIEEWEQRTFRKSTLRSYKDTLARVRNRLKIVYSKRFDKDLRAFRLGDANLLSVCDHFKEYLEKFISQLKQKESKLKNVDFKQTVEETYNDLATQEGDYVFLYNPEWPPFRDSIMDPNELENKEKVRKSFGRLISCLKGCIDKKEDGLDKYFFETLDGLLNKLNNMVLFLLGRLGPLRMIEEGTVFNDSHQMTAMYIEHFEFILDKLKEAYHKHVCEGPIRKYLKAMHEKNEENEARSKLIKVPFQEIEERFITGIAGYETREFWEDLSMRIYRFCHILYSETKDNNFVRAYVDALKGVLGCMNEISEEIIAFSKNQMTQGFIKGKKLVNLYEIKEKISRQDIFDFLTYSSMAKDFMPPHLKSYMEDDNKDFENYVDAKYLDARNKIYEVYLANQFRELYRIEPIKPFTRVTFLESQEEYYLNIPVYFKVDIGEAKVSKIPKFEYVAFPKSKEEKKPGVHIVEDEALKTELNREFKYLDQKPEELKYEQVYSKFFEKLNMEQWINLIFRKRNIIHQGKYYDYVDQISFTHDEGSEVVNERMPQVSCVEDIMKKGFGYCKYSLTIKKKLPFPIPFSSGFITNDSIINVYLLSKKHMISVSKSASEGIPFADSFFIIVVTDVVEQSDGIEVKWSLALDWKRSTMVKPILESQVPGEAKKQVMTWSQIAEEVIRTNKPEEEVERPDVVEVDIEMANFRTNPVFIKKVEELNIKAAIHEQEEMKVKSPLEIFKENFQFEKAKADAIAVGTQGATAKGLSDSMTSWDIIPARLRNSDPLDDDGLIERNSFDGIEFIEKVNELDESEKKKAYFVLLFLAFLFLYKLFIGRD